MARWDRDEGPYTRLVLGSSGTEPETRAIEVDECDVLIDFTLSRQARHASNSWHERSFSMVGLYRPQLLDRFQIAAMDLTGMGDSDYRYNYNSETYALEITGVMNDAGFDSSGVVVAHSFGGYMAVKAANLYPEKIGNLILVDSVSGTQRIHPR